MGNASDNERRTSRSRLLEHHRDHAAAQVRAHARDLGGDLGRRVVDAAKTEAREVRRQIGRDVDLARREAADQLADDQPAQAASPLRLEDADRAEFVDAAVGLDPPESNQPPALARDHELLGGEVLVVEAEAPHALGDRPQVAGRGRVELLAFASPPPPPPRPRAMNQHGLTHLSFRVADLDATLAALRAAGERVLEETVIRFPAYQSAACFIVDPDGQLIELVQAPGDPAAPPRAG